MCIPDISPSFPVRSCVSHDACVHPIVHVFRVAYFGLSAGRVVLRQDLLVFRTSTYGTVAHSGHARACEPSGWIEGPTPWFFFDPAHSKQRTALAAGADFSPLPSGTMRVRRQPTCRVNLPPYTQPSILLHMPSSLRKIPMKS